VEVLQSDGTLHTNQLTHSFSNSCVQHISAACIAWHAGSHATYPLCRVTSLQRILHFLLLYFTAAGMPYPQNLQTALEVQEVVRQHGATPATIAIIAGQPCIGTCVRVVEVVGLGPCFQTLLVSMSQNCTTHKEYTRA